MSDERAKDKIEIGSIAYEGKVDLADDNSSNSTTRKGRVQVVIDDGRIEPIKEFQSPEKLYANLIERVQKYHPSDDISMIEKAYRIASEAHKDQVRKSGEPYIIHPVAVAKIVLDYGMDYQSVAAAMLHDTVEDTDLTLEEVKKEFGNEIAALVDGMKPEEVIERVEGIRCGFKNTSCPDQLAQALRKAVENG
mgnify:CR=1 FL=1